MNLQFIIASHNPNILKANIFASDCYRKYPFAIMTGYTNISKAYNEATELNEADIYVYVHHDVYMPLYFDKFLLQAIEGLKDTNWGVLGVAGVHLNGKGKEYYGFLNDRGRYWGNQFDLPHEVQTLDEVLLVTKGDFVFDENLDTDFYGADICLESIKRGQKNYAINAYIEHNSSRPVGHRTEGFYKCQEYFREKWKEFLPIGTTCCLIEK